MLNLDRALDEMADSALLRNIQSLLNQLVLLGFKPQRPRFLPLSDELSILISSHFMGHDPV